jgi:integral membrane protein (TIGR01906 family)
LKILFRLLKAITIISIPLFLFSLSLAWGFNSQWLYQFGFDKYDVSDITGFSEEELSGISNSMIDYFNNSEEYVEIFTEGDGQTSEVFTEEEKIHFKDVKALVKIDYLICIISLGIIIIFLICALMNRKSRKVRDAALTFLSGSVLSISLIIILGIVALTSFDQFFLEFHHLVFTNPHWSAPGYMLLLFPGGFWQDAAVICISFAAFWSMAFGFISWFYLYKIKR